MHTFATFSASMADQCIICLEDLDVVPDPIHDNLRDAGGVAAAPIAELLSEHPRHPDNQLAIALIKPCGHVLHDQCLREWSQKANSCPICRHVFNLVEVLDKVGGVVLSEYTVEDRKQVAEFDPNAWIEENPEEDTTPCPICGANDQEECLLLCDGCDAPYHTHCIGLDRVPHGNWFCMECEAEGAYARAAEPVQSPSRSQRLSGRTQPRTQASLRHSRQRMRSDNWVGQWSRFSSRVYDFVGLDLDFSEDDFPMASYRQHQRRSTEETREFQMWQQRLNIAGRQGARDVFRNAAPPTVRPRTPATPEETAEELKAWGALEKAKDLDTASPRRRKRKSRSITTSPTERSESPKEPERKLKRPRTRRIVDVAGPSTASASRSNPSRQTHGTNRRGGPSSRANAGTNGEPSFLSALLREVETATSDDDTSRPVIGRTITAQNRVTSPSIEYSSPAASPSSASSAYHTPRPMSTTPPPHIAKRPGSPLPLTSRIEPIFPPAEYSRNRSAPETSHKSGQDHSTSPMIELKQPRPRRQAPVALTRSQGASPVRATMSIEAKEGINKIVKSALGPHWKSGKITKEQYANINRDVSRKLYEVVAGRNISDEKEKGAWEKLATTEVGMAVKSLTA